MTDKSLVVQHNKIIEAKYRLSIGEQRLVKLLVSMISRDDEDFKPYQIRIADLADLLGIKSGDIYPAMKKATKKLIGNVLTFESFDGDESIQTAWLSSARYMKGYGIAELQFSPILKPFLLQLKEHFTAYELGNVINLKHLYSIRIYEILKQYERIGHRKFTVENLRELLMLKENEYKQFCDFRRWVLKPAQKELSEKTDITFEWKEERQNQKCISIEFIITKQLRNNTINTLLIEEETKKVERIAQTKEIKHECKKIADLLFELGISSEMSKELAENHMEEEIRLAIDYTKTLQTEGKIKNPAGFLVDAIRKGFRDNHAEERKRKEETVKAKENKEALRKEWERMKTRWNAWRVERVEAYMASLDAETLDREKALFRESLKGSVMAKAIYSNPESEARHFRIYQTGKMLGLGLLEWAQEVGVDMTPFMEYARFEGKL